MPRTDALLSPSKLQAGPSASCECAACGTARAAGAKYCPQCGKPLDPPPPKNHPPETADSRRAESQCSCGRVPPTDASFCPGCGSALSRDGAGGLCLSYTVQGQTSQVVPLGNEPITIGSGGDCDVVLAGDSRVSRRHVRITRDDSMILAEDLASSNGTLLRIRRSVAIEPGDELVVGTTVLRLEQGS